MQSSEAFLAGVTIAVEGLKLVAMQAFFYSAELFQKYFPKGLAGRNPIRIMRILGWGHTPARYPRPCGEGVI